MPIAITYRLRGFAELDQAMRALGDIRQTKPIGRAGLRAAARVALPIIRIRAPVRGTSRLKFKFRGRRRAGLFRPGAFPGFLRRELRMSDVFDDRDGLKIKIGTGLAFYGMFLEFGTSRMPARPWMRPGFQSSHAGALEAMRVAMSVELNLLVARLAKGRA